MMRILLILLAVVIAVLAFVLDQPWLYWTAGALLAAAVIALGVYLWQRYQEATRFRRRREQEAPVDRQKELNDLGIVDVRPRTKRAEAPSYEDTEDDLRSPSASEAPAEEDPAASVAAKAPPEPAAEAGPETEETPADADPVFGPYVQALRAAVEAHTVCLLVQEEMVPTYRIEAATSRHNHVRAAGTFETAKPLLTARMTQRAVTVRPVGGEGGVDPELLGYYREPPALEYVAFAPVPCPSTSATYFLVVDATDAHLQTSRAKKVLAHFSELLGLLIEMKEASGGVADEGVPEEPVEEAAEPRPRRDIIAEEMEKARRESKPLALTLVHLNRAEALAEQGETVVADAEEALRTRLERSAPRSRVERFGELTYGIFYNGHVAEVEPWTERLQEEMKAAPGVLAGGVSIGVAIMREEPQPPERLRENATEALRMAYETGTCTIVE